MIKGMHGLFYTPYADELRVFIRDKLGLAHNDIGDGWLIFRMLEADLGVHPSDKSYHSISFYCDDIRKTVEELRLRGVEFSSDITDEGWGLLTHLRMPGNLEVELYQPKYKKHPPHEKSKSRTRPKSRQRGGKRSR